MEKYSIRNCVKNKCASCLNFLLLLMIYYSVIYQVDAIDLSIDNRLFVAPSGEFKYILRYFIDLKNFNNTITELRAYGDDTLRKKLSGIKKYALEIVAIKYCITSNCYTRKSIGSRLPDSQTLLTFTTDVISDCEVACSANKTSCNSFSFGVGLKGNGTCVLSSDIPNQERLSMDQDYDTYVKGHISLFGCLTRPSKTEKLIPSLLSQTINGMNGQIEFNADNKTSTLMINSDPPSVFGNFSLLNFIGNSVFSRNKNRSSMSDNNNTNNINNNINNNKIVLRKLPKNLFPAENDDERRIYDILQNKQNPYSKSNYNHERINHDSETSTPLYANFGSDAFGSEVQTFWPLSEPVKIKNINYFGFTDDIEHNKDIDHHHDNNYHKNTWDDLITGPKMNQESFPAAFDFTGEFGRRLNYRPFIFDSSDANFWFDSSIDHTTPWYEEKSPENLNPTIVETYESVKGEKACFRKLISGKRIINAYVRRTLECDRLQDCYRMCEYERGFTCEGFNYRSQIPNSKSICELTSTPPSRVNLQRDFTPDHQCDFYERDWTHTCFHKDQNAKDPKPPPNWRQPSRPHWRTSDGHQTYGAREPRPTTPAPSAIVPYGGSFKENTQLTIEIPRPIDPSRRPIDSRPAGPYGDNDWRHRDRPLPVQPLEDHYPGYGGRRPSDYRPRDSDSYYYNRIPQRMPRPERPFYSSLAPGDYYAYNGNGYSYGHPNKWQGNHYDRRYPQRRIGYGSDPALNEVAPYSPEYRKPVKPGWGPPSYADAYHHHYISDYKPQLPPVNDHDHLAPPYSTRIPNERDHYHGQVYNYGGAYGYFNNPVMPTISSPTSGTQECSVRSAGGFKLIKGIVRKSYLTPNLQQCEHLCGRQTEFTCLTYAFRYNIAPTSPSDNCFLSEVPFENLVFYTDVEPDRDYDIYTLIKDPKWCEIHEKPAYPPSRGPHNHPNECFWRVKSGFGMPPSVTKKPVRVDGMGECQVQCVKSREFTCRSFVYKYEIYPVDGLPNCFLSDWPAMEMDPGHMQNMEGAELYERGSFGRGCEPHSPVIPPPDPPYTNRPDANRKKYGYHQDDASCYTGYDRPCKLTPYAIIMTSKADSQAECRRKCSMMRQRESTPCMAFSYKIDPDYRGDNCYLSDIATRDLRPGLDYTHDDHYNLYTWKELEPKCSWIPQNYIPNEKPIAPYIYELHIPSDSNRPSLEPPKPELSPEPPALYGTGHPSYPGPRPEYGVGEKFFFPTVPDEFLVFRHFTVNGAPCKRGTRCERSKLAGFWSCEPEGSEPGSWDYCCEPSHQCGYSYGHNFPWCYVGPSKDQWRPCSEKYYPYQINPRPLRPPIRGSRPRLNECDHNCDGRHWPIAFLHGEAPPNSTDSVALANDVTDGSATESSTYKYSESTQSDENNVNDLTPSILNNSTNSPSDNDMSDGNNNSSNNNGNNGNSFTRRLTKKRRVRLSSPLRLKNTRNLLSTSLNIKSIRLSQFNRNASNTVNSNNTGLNNSKSVPPKNVTIEFSPLFSKDEMTGQYFITKKLNTELTMPSVGKLNITEEQPKPSMAKIERIRKIDFSRNKTKSLAGHFVTIASTKSPKLTTSNLILTTPAVKIVMSGNNDTNVNETRHWERVTTIDSTE